MKAQQRLREDFLSPYFKKGDCFPSLLARSTYVSKYARDDEAWTDTIRRVVDGNCDIDPNVSMRERELLFHAFWTMQALPPGRGLWVGGIGTIPAEAHFNCFYTTVYDFLDWTWIANMLMLGGGVGVGLSEIASLPIISKKPANFQVGCKPTHVNAEEVKADFGFFHERLGTIVLEDSREGWVDGLRLVLRCAYAGEDLSLDFSLIRPRGAPIKTFGGVACGPGPLVDMLRSVWRVVRGAAGRKLNSVEALDITNYLGKCIKSGNVRRSALIALGHPMDQAFRDAKKDFDAVMSHRHTSNNSICFHRFEEFEKFDWRGLVEDNIEFGEPGILNLALGRRTDPGAMGVNPCYHGDTLVQTRVGHFRIKDLVGKNAEVWDGTSWRAVNTFEVTGKNKQLLRIEMQDGTELRVTKNHKMVLEGQKQMIEASELSVGMKLQLSEAELTHGTGTTNAPYLKGFLLGYGSLTGSENADLWLYRPKFMCEKRLLSSAKEIAPSAPVKGALIELSFEYADEDRTDRKRLEGLAVRKELIPWCRAYKEGLPAEVFAWDQLTKVDFLAGLFDADGTAQDTKHGFHYQLSMVSRKLLLDVQLLLKTIGVQSKVALNKPANMKDFGEKCGGLCAVQALYRLTISQESSIAFAKQAVFDRLVSFSYKTTEHKVTSTRNTVMAIEMDEIAEQVYCLVTDDPDRIGLTNGLLVGRCGEQLLHDREACNLAEVFPANFDGSIDKEVIFKLVARYCLRQRLKPLTLDQRAQDVAHRNMRVGVGLGGICDFEWDEPLLSSWFKIVRGECNNYADDLKVARPITTTTVKPSGTISLLCGSSPGMHAPFAPYYIRRTRHAINDPMTQALMEAGVPWEFDQYDNTGKTLCFSFPMKAKHTKTTVQTESLLDQFDRQLKVQNAWADNAVSCTITFDKDKPEELASLLEHYAPQLKSTSCLPGAHGYAQAPYEVIDAAVFEDLARGINFDAKLVKGELDIEECAGGACPVK